MDNTRIIETAAGYVDVKALPEQRLTNFTIKEIQVRGKVDDPIHKMLLLHANGRQMEILVDLRKQTVMKFNITLLSHTGGHFIFNGSEEQLQRMLLFAQQQTKTAVGIASAVPPSQ